MQASLVPRPLRWAPIALLLALAAGLFACGGPLVMIPGGRLSGEVAPPPIDWSFSDAIETVQLETRPSDPYSVNVWGVGIGPAFYVAAGETGNAWIGHIQADSHVRLRLDGRVYELRATLTDEPSELEAFVAAVKVKYDFEPDPEQRANARLFRLEPREGR